MEIPHLSQISVPASGTCAPVDHWSKTLSNVSGQTQAYTWWCCPKTSFWNACFTGRLHCVCVVVLHYWRQMESCKLRWSISKSGAKAWPIKGPTSTQNNITARIHLFGTFRCFDCWYCKAGCILNLNLKEVWWNQGRTVGKTGSWVNSACITDIPFLLDRLNKPIGRIRVLNLWMVLSAANPLGHLRAPLS